jgi:site-specific DNA-methyltransferase (adenine-specific)
LTFVAIHRGDCLDLLPGVPDGCVDLVLVDLPYGMTAFAWDQVIPFDRMWQQLRRVGKKACAYVFFAQQPFTTDLISSNRKAYRYNWTWLKSRSTGFQYSRFQPMRRTEDICVFYWNQPKYDKQGAAYEAPTSYKTDGINAALRTDWEGVTRTGGGVNGALRKDWQPPTRAQPARVTGTGRKMGPITRTYTHRTKDNVIQIGSLCASQAEDSLLRHPTQKPVALLRYLIETYTEPGDVVLDFTMGCGSTGVAAKQLGRSFVGFELTEDYFNEAQRRIAAAQAEAP